MPEPTQAPRELIELDLGISNFLRGVGAIPMADAFDQDLTTSPSEKYAKLRKLFNDDVPSVDELLRSGTDLMLLQNQRSTMGLPDDVGVPGQVAPPAPDQEEQGLIEQLRANEEMKRKMLEGT